MESLVSLGGAKAGATGIGTPPTGFGSKEDVMAIELGIEGRIAAISGGSEGLGKAIARRLAAEGARVAICARRLDVLERTANEIRQATGGDVLSIAADMSSAEDTERFMRDTVDHFGGIDILVNNAGTHAASPFEEIDDELWAYDFNQKFFSAVRCTRMAIPVMRERGGGRIINITHVTAKAPRPESLPTVASRAAAMAMTKTLAREFAADNILVNTVCLGAVKTAQWEKRRLEQAPDMPVDDWYEQLSASRGIPLGRFGDADEAADLVAYLVSERANYITGTAINFDGGSSWTL